MNEYNVSTEEITKVISLYSQIKSSEKRMYAQGYLNGLVANITLENKNQPQKTA